MMKQKKVGGGGGGGGLALGEAAAAGMGTTSRSPRSERQAEVAAGHRGGRSLACQSISPLLFHVIPGCDVTWNGSCGGETTGSS